MHIEPCLIEITFSSFFRRRLCPFSCLFWSHESRQARLAAESAFVSQFQIQAYTSSTALQFDSRGDPSFLPRCVTALALIAHEGT